MITIIMMAMGIIPWGMFFREAGIVVQIVGLIGVLYLGLNGMWLKI